MMGAIPPTVDHLPLAVQGENRRWHARNLEMLRDLKDTALPWDRRLLAALAFPRAEVERLDWLIETMRELAR